MRVLGRRVTIAGTLFEPDELARYACDAGLEILLCETRPPYPREYASERLYLLARAVTAETAGD